MKQKMENINGLPNSARIYLNPVTGSELIKKAVEKAGSKRALVKNILLYAGRSPDVTKLEKIMRGVYGIPKHRFMRLIRFLEIPDDEIISYIKEIKYNNIMKTMSQSRFKTNSQKFLLEDMFREKLFEIACKKEGSLRQLGRKLGYTGPAPNYYVNRMKRGEQLINLRQLKILSEITNIDFSEILKHVKEKK
jgi:hypothetical protein